MSIPTIQWKNGCVKLIDQTLLPNKFQIITCRNVKTLWDAIKRLSVRGAPALGAAAAFGVLLGAKTFKGHNRKTFDHHVKKVSDYIASSRPTAVNLFKGIAQMQDVLKANPKASVAEIKSLLEKEAKEVFKDDQRVCRQMAEYGSKLIKNGGRYLTICNTGALATVDYGTALGVFTKAKEKKLKFKVYACETRPLLQGARLTIWELLKQRIDTTLICDSMAATLMKQGKIDAVFTGADRVAANGDSANKIGTYSLAVLARYHKVPFYIVAPTSTFDLKTSSGKKIPIEERDADEVRMIKGVQIAPKNVNVFNPAFDVTDNKLITALVTEAGIIRPVNKSNVTQTIFRYASRQKTI